MLSGNGKGSHLTQVFPHNVQSSAANYVSCTVFGNKKFLNRLVELNSFFAKQHARLDEWAAEIGNVADVFSLRGTDLD
jgi:hypothetical protein